MRKYKIFFLTALISILASACIYDFMAPEPPAPINGGGNGGNGEETVSFVNDIVPIFEAKCTSCHKAGGIKPNPDLTADKAYASIATSKYINLDTPEDSYLYVHIYSNTSAHTQKKFTAAEAQLVLTWITEGAKNN